MFLKMAAYKGLFWLHKLFLIVLSSGTNSIPMGGVKTKTIGVAVKTEVVAVKTKLKYKKHSTVDVYWVELRKNGRGCRSTVFVTGHEYYYSCGSEIHLFVSAVAVVFDRL